MQCESSFCASKQPPRPLYTHWEETLHCQMACVHYQKLTAQWSLWLYIANHSLRVSMQQRGWAMTTAYHWVAPLHGGGSSSNSIFNGNKLAFVVSKALAKMILIYLCGFAWSNLLLQTQTPTPLPMALCGSIYWSHIVLSKQWTSLSYHVGHAFCALKSLLSWLVEL